jgi:glutamine amidotransferase
VKAGIVDYGMGNLASVGKAVEGVGVEPLVSSSLEQLGGADVLVLPGVGNFAAGMRNLRDAGLDQFISEWAAQRKPTLGICLGMQLLFDHSEEGDTAGLGILPGKVTLLPDVVKVPHMGWNEVSTPEGSPFRAFDGQRFYFVHSYVCDVQNGMGAGFTDYGVSFASMVSKDNVVGVQFHPEKSSESGLELLKEIFARWR